MKKPALFLLLAIILGLGITITASPLTSGAGSCDVPYEDEMEPDTVALDDYPAEVIDLNEPVKILDTITAARAFKDIPLHVLDIISRDTRSDMLGYYGRDSIWVAKNAMEGTSHLVKVTLDYLKAVLTRVSTLEIKILPSKKYKDIALTVYTLNNEPGERAGDSQLSFFDANLRPLPAKVTDKMFKVPQVKDFFEIPKGSLTTMKEIEDMIPFPTIVYEVSPDNTNLTARLTVGEYISIDDYNILKLFLKPEITYQWTGKEFKLIK